MRARNFLQVRAPLYSSLRNWGNNRAARHTFIMNNVYAQFLLGNKNKGNIDSEGNKNEKQGSILGQGKSLQTLMFTGFLWRRSLMNT